MGLSCMLMLLLPSCTDEVIAPTVPDDAPDPASIVVAPEQAVLGIGDTVRLSGSVVDEDGNALTGHTLSWGSADPEVATVSGDGLVRARTQGTSYIRVSLEGDPEGAASGGAVITVEPDTMPPASNWIYPGEDIQARVDAEPAGTTFLLKAGIHRLQSVVPKDGNTFQGESGTIVSGARRLTGFERDGGHWIVGNQTQEGQVHGACSGDYTGCRYPEDVFIDGEALRQVTSRSALGPGRWYFDYDADRIYLYDDPRGRTVETSVVRHAFRGDAHNVTIRNLVVEKYANPAQHGAIHAIDGTAGALSSGWVIQRVTVRRTHGAGIRTGHRMRILNSRVVSNGQIGIVGLGDDIRVEATEIAFNNTADFETGWEAGGTKFVATRDLVVRGNHVHHNHGPGLWADIDNIHTLYEDNLVEDNEGPGIYHEISYDAIIRNNTVRRNGHGYSVWLWGAGILVSASSNVEVYGNTVSENADGIAAVQQDRDEGRHGDWVVENLYVHDNVVTMTHGATGLVQDIGDDSYFTSRNNRFEDNTYHLGSQGPYFAWLNSLRTEEEWRSYGHDVNGEFHR